MKIQHVRNATMRLTIAEHHLLVDPMLSRPGALPGFKIFGGGRRRNPLVPLPPGTDEALESITAVLVTHEHLDHLDTPGIEWIKRRGLPVWASPVDARNLRRKGLDVHEMTDGALGMAVEVVRVRHGRGVVGWMMGPVSGYYLAHPGEPSVYMTSDAGRMEEVLEAVDRLRPDIVVAPAGAANFGLGSDILLSMNDLVALVEHAPGAVVFNHLEAVDHCPTTRGGLRRRMAAAGLDERVYVPEDGQIIEFSATGTTPRPQVRVHASGRPGLQKWLTARFAGT